MSGIARPMKVPIEYCKFVVKWRGLYLGTHEGGPVEGRLVPKGGGWTRGGDRQHRRVFGDPDEASAAAAKLRAEIRKEFDCEPRVKVARLIPGPKRRVILMAELYVGVIELHLSSKDFGTFLKISETLDLLKEAVRDNNAKKG